MKLGPQLQQKIIFKSENHTSNSNKNVTTIGRIYTAASSTSRQHHPPNAKLTNTNSKDLLLDSKLTHTNNQHLPTNTKIKAQIICIFHRMPKLRNINFLHFPSDQQINKHTQLASSITITNRQYLQPDAKLKTQIA